MENKNFKIKNVKLYDHALSDEEVRAVYENLITAGWDDKHRLFPVKLPWYRRIWNFIRRKK